MPIARAAAAAVIVVSILACSGSGLCWTLYVTTTHECCEQERTAAPAKPCSSVGTLVAGAAVMSASETAFPITLTLPSATSAAPRARWQASPAKAPPLVLRV